MTCDRGTVLLSHKYVVKTTHMEENIMPDIKELLPFIIPLIIVQFILLAVTLRHIFTHNTYKRGNRTIWVIVAIIGMEFIGPILYFLLGKEDS